MQLHNISIWESKNPTSINSSYRFWKTQLEVTALCTLSEDCPAKFSHIAWTYVQNAAGYLEKNSPEFKSPSTDFGVKSKCDLRWQMRLVEQAMSTKSVCWWWCRAWYKSRLLMLLTFGATGRLGVRLLQEHPLQRPLVDEGLYTQVNNSPLPRGQHQQYPIHYKGQRRKEGGRQGRERNNKHLFTVTVVTSSTIFFLDLWLALKSLRWIDWFRWI